MSTSEVTPPNVVPTPDAPIKRVIELEADESMEISEEEEEPLFPNVRRKLLFDGI